MRAIHAFHGNSVKQFSVLRQRCGSHVSMGADMALRAPRVALLDTAGLTDAKQER
jgi:hypothetical protein